MSTEMSEESTRLIKFDGIKRNWYQWSVQKLALAKARGFRMMYSKNHNPCSDKEYKVETDKGVRAIYKANNKAYQLLIMSCTGIAFGLVNQAKTKTWIDDDAYMVWKNLEARYAPHSVPNLIQLASDFNKCKLNDSSSDPDKWFIDLDLMKSKMMAIDRHLRRKKWK